MPKFEPGYKPTDQQRAAQRVAQQKRRAAERAEAELRRTLFQKLKDTTSNG